MAPENPDKALPAKLWDQLEPMVQAASKYSSLSLMQWADLVYPHALLVDETSNKVLPHELWRGRLGHVYDKVLKAGYECPYDTTYLLRLAEAKKKLTDMSLTWNSFPVRPSVIIEGRNLDSDTLREILETEGVEKDGKVLLTVSRMKAHVHKEATGSSDSVEDIEDEQSANRRRSDRKGGEHKSKTDQLVAFIAGAKDSTDVLLNISSLLMEAEYKLKRLIKNGEEIDMDALERAQDRMNDLQEVLTEASEKAEA